MIKFGYLIFTILESFTVAIGIILLICLIYLMIKQNNFLESINIYPKMLEILIIVVISIVLGAEYLILDYNDRYNMKQLKKCCKNI